MKRVLFLIVLVEIIRCGCCFRLRREKLTSVWRVATIENIPERVESNVKHKLLDYFDRKAGLDIFVCPETLDPLEYSRKIYGLFTQQSLLNRKYDISYPINSFYIDFVRKDGLQSQKLVQAFFQNPVLSYFYERGYRQNFALYGFPGIDKEFEEVRDYFVTNNATSVVLDLSCGSGFMTRKLISSGRFKRVLAADLSPTMLLETYRNCQVEGLSAELIRCDVSKLPFPSNSLDGIHAGAAMHCWPNIVQALAEIYRVLKPGGVYFATTIKQSSPEVFKEAANRQGFTFFPSEAEVTNLLIKAGFGNETGNCEVRREGGRCFVIQAKKLTPSEVITVPVD